MNIIGCLNWYEESPSWLAAAVASWSRFGITHLVAVDGAYALFPDGHRRSGSEQAEAIYEITNALEIGTILYVPPRLWRDEVEKRNFMFMLAEQVVEDPERDWYACFDADEVLTETGGDVRKILGKTTLDAAEFTLWQRYDSFSYGQPGAASTMPRMSEQQHRHVFRAIPGLRWVDNHYTCRTPDGRLLRGNPNNIKLEEAVQLPGLRVEHRTMLRDSARRMQAYRYYSRVREEGLERAQCAYCEEQSVCDLPWDLEDRDGHLLFSYIEVCPAHVEGVIDAGKARFKELGYAPEGFVTKIREEVARAGYDLDELLEPTPV
jgi:hypothetical protein